MTQIAATLQSVFMDRQEDQNAQQEVLPNQEVRSILDESTNEIQRNDTLQRNN